jgi:hypothetical protein
MKAADKKKVVMAIAATTNAHPEKSVWPLMIRFHNEIMEEGKGARNIGGRYRESSRCGTCLQTCKASVMHYYHTHMNKYKELEYQDRTYGRYNMPVYTIKKTEE